MDGINIINVSVSCGLCDVVNYFITSDRVSTIVHISTNYYRYYMFRHI